MSETNMNADDPESQEPEEKSLFGIIVHSFFIIPFLIAVFCVLLFTAFSLLTKEQQTVYDYIEDIKTGGSTKRWQAAFELSKILANPKHIPKDERFIAELKSAYRKSKGDDSRVKQYLALAMGRTGNTEFLNVLIDDLAVAKEENMSAIIYALGMLKDKRAVPVLLTRINSPNPKIRSMTVVALGSIGDRQSKKNLKKALNDLEANVQWGAAISLAQLGDDSGLGIIGKLLDRDYLSSFAEVDPKEQNHLILTAINAVSQLDTTELDSIIYKLAENDKNMKVRSAAKIYTDK